ncbi:MAG: SusC/RagA family TonB-linked outer membrane protein [Bacteroidaceae bacterium]|nr:SusC/RagA family TonB-linked outer membrane protein [Bacteroidaceae bacterium]
MKRINKSIIALPLALMAFAPQGAFAQEEADGVQADTVNMAFRKVDARDIVQPYSKVKVSEIIEKGYSTYNLDNMQALAAGFNGDLWQQGSALVFVDGVPRNVGNLLPDEIEDITFLKGASAVVLYGSKAAKGAILITTKRGKEQSLKTSVRANYQLFVPKSYPKWLGAAEYMKYYNEALVNDGKDALYSDEDIYNTATGVNPYKYPDQSFYGSEYLKKNYDRWDVNAEFNGGGKYARFYTNVTYSRASDLLKYGEAKNNYSDRLNIRGNVDLTLSDIVTGWVNAKVSFNNARSAKGNYWNSSATLRPNRVAPLIPTSYIEELDKNSLSMINNSRYIIDGKYFLGGTQYDQTNIFADLLAAGYTQTVSRHMQFDTGFRLDLGKILEGLSFKTQFAVDYATAYQNNLSDKYATYGVEWTNYDGKDVVSSLTKYGKDEHSGTLSTSNSASAQEMSFNAQFDYKRTFDDVHNVHATLVANGFQETTNGSYHRTSNANLGLQASYNYAQRYYADLGANVVHSAKLAEGHREALSPSLTLGWRLTEEDFLKDNSIFNDLMLTAGYTVLNQDIDIKDYYMYESIFTATGTWWGWSDEHNSIQTADSQRGKNYDLTYVKRKEFNVGVNALMLDKKLSFKFNFFNTVTDGTLATVDHLYPSYFHTYYPVSTFIPYVNYGKERRTGFDFSVGYKDKAGDFEYAVELNGMSSTSKYLKYAENVEYDYRKHEGRSTNAMWGLECLGYYESADEIKNATAKSSFSNEIKPGDLKYKDQNNDGVIDDKDEVVIGNWGDKFIAGLNFTLKYKNWTLFGVMTGNFGGEGLKRSLEDWCYGDRKFSTVVRGAWTAEKAATGQEISYPRLTAGDGSNNFRASSYWKYSTSRVNMGRIQLTYDFNADMLGSASKFVKGLQLYVNANDLFMIAGERKYMETEVGVAPQTRSFTLGAKVQF